MKSSLRIRVLLMVFAINALVFGAGGLYLLEMRLDESERRVAERTQDSMRSGAAVTIRPDEPNVAYILGWPSWEDVEDALLVDATLEERPSGLIEVAGLALNPVGTKSRPWDFSRQEVLRALREAIRTNEPVRGVAGGWAVPLASTLGDEAWGGVWYRTRVEVDRLEIAGQVAPWFVLSTLALTLVSFSTLRKLVLQPVELLAGGARRVRSGDFSVQLAVPPRRDEIADLVRSFNEMTSTVRGFNDHLADEVRRATEQARQAEAAAMTQRRLAAMGELAAGIAHEINNPLGGLQNAVVTLGRTDLAPEKRERYLGLLADGLTRIGETVHRLRRFTPRSAPHEPLPLVDVARDSIDLVRHRADRAGVELVLLVDGDIPEIAGARNEVGQALLNLLTNSIDAIETDPEREAGRRPRGGRIEVRVEAGGDVDPGVVRLVIRDDGPGVPPDELERVEDLFYTTKEVGKGTGLGLPLVHNTVRQHGGHVRIRSESGAFFEVELLFPGLDGGPAA